MSTINPNSLPLPLPLPLSLPIFEQCPPQLASSLYQRESDQKRVSEAARKNKDSGPSTGIRLLDRELPTTDLFCGGRIVGLGGIEDLHVHALTILHYVASAHILHGVQNPQSSGSCPSLFLIEPTPSTLSSTDTSLLQIYSLLDQTQRDRKNIELDALIDRIAVLRPLDPVGISQSLSEANDAISSARQQNDGTKKMVIIRGLSDCVFDAFNQDNNARSTGSVTKTAALLSRILRQIRLLVAKPHRDVLVVLEVVGYLARSKSGTRSGLGIGDEDSSTQRDTDRSGGTQVVEDVAPDVKSAFVSADGSAYKIGLGQRWLEQEREQTSRLQQRQTQHQTNVDFSFKPSDPRMRIRRDCTTLAAMFEEVLDTCILVHDGYGITHTNDGGRRALTGVAQAKHIVEVVKDEKGASQGAWTVWNVEEKRAATGG